MGARSADKIRKHFSETFNELGLKITVQTNLKRVNFLDITLDLNSGKYRLHRKPENPPLYINAKSNHPPTIISQLPHSVGSKIARLSCNNEEFDKVAPPYNEALRASGYRSTIQEATAENDSTASQSQNTRKRNRSRNTIWFNSPFSQNVKTNVGKTFLRLIYKHFPKTSKLHKIFNRRNVKISYSCMGNMTTVIRQHDIQDHLFRTSRATAGKNPTAH